MSSPVIASNAQQIANAGSAATSSKVEVTAFHKSLYDLMQTARKSSETMHNKMVVLLKSKYGEAPPTYAQFRADRAALKLLATDKGLADDQWVRKPYNRAVLACYGALPEAQTAAAIARRKVREMQAANKVSNGKAGAVKGETAPRRTGTPETVEQYIARVGVYKVIEACAKILEGDKATATAATALHGLAKAA